MAAQKGKSKPINLLPQDEFESSITGRVLKWILTTFRMIVIAVELVVIIGFLSRFFLDAESSNLTDEIEQKEALILSYSSFEKEFKLAQSKLNFFSTLTAGDGSSLILEEVVRRLPIDVQLTSFADTAIGVEIKGSTTSEISAAQFVANLQSVSQFSEVALTQIDSRADSTFLNFTVVGVLSGQNETEEENV